MAQHPRNGCRHLKAMKTSATNLSTVRKPPETKERLKRRQLMVGVLGLDCLLLWRTFCGLFFSGLAQRASALFISSPRNVRCGIAPVVHLKYCIPGQPGLHSAFNTIIPFCEVRYE